MRVSPIVLTLLCPICVASPPPPPPGGGCNASTLEGMNIVGSSDIVHFPSESAAECAASCCTLQRQRCLAYTWTSWQPHTTPQCVQHTKCCWLKAEAGMTAPQHNCTSGRPGGVGPSPSPPSPPPIPGLKIPRLKQMRIIALDPTGNLRDPSAVVQDPVTGKWHFWAVYMPGATQPGWQGFLHHYESVNSSIDTTEWVSLGLALNHSSDPHAFDSGGMFSPSAIHDPNGSAPGWYLFYSGTGANFTTNFTCAQLVARSSSPYGPWTRLGLVAYPSLIPGTWNKLRVDSGRAQIVGGQRGYWTKGVEDDPNLAREGLYLPVDSSSFAPPYTQWSGNPVWSPSPPEPQAGYENCEFFRGPDDYLHILCQYHGRGQPHLVTPLHSTGVNWTLAGTVSTAPALEPTPVYEGGMPGDEAIVRFFIARTETGRHGPGALAIGLYALEWD